MVPSFFHSTVHTSKLLPPPPLCWCHPLPLAAVSATHCAANSLRWRLRLLFCGAAASCLLGPPVVQGRIHLCLLPCLRLSSHLCLALHPLCLVGCCISQSLSRSLLSHHRPVPQPPPFIMHPPFVTPLLFSWLSFSPVPQPPSGRNSAWCLGLRLLFCPCL